MFVSALAALSSRVALHVFVLSPSREYWGSIRSEREILRAARAAREARVAFAQGAAALR